VPEIPLYLQDTPHLLRQLEKLNTSNIPKGAFPISIDVVGLYVNILIKRTIYCEKIIMLPMVGRESPHRCERKNLSDRQV
jgi:hypothetical protein